MKEEEAQGGEGGSRRRRDRESREGWGGRRKKCIFTTATATSCFFMSVSSADSRRERRGAKKGKKLKLKGKSGPVIGWRSARKFDIRHGCSIGLDNRSAGHGVPVREFTISASRVARIDERATDAIEFETRSFQFYEE